MNSVLQDEHAGRDGDLYIRSVSFSPDGKFLATGAEDKQIRIWDIAKNRIRRILQGHEQDIYSLEFSRDGSILVSGSGDRTARIWAWDETRCVHILPIQEQDQKDPGVTSVAISPDGHLVAAGSLDKMVRVWDATTGQQLERLEGHKDSVYSVAFLPDGKTLISGSLDKTLRMWQLGSSYDRSRNPCKQVFTGHKDFVLSVATTADGAWIVSGSKDRGVQFWDPRTGQTQFMLQGHKNSGRHTTETEKLLLLLIVPLFQLSRLPPAQAVGPSLPLARVITGHVYGHTILCINSTNKISKPFVTMHTT